VGSEMCIRDSVEVAKVVHVHVALGAPGLAGDVAEAGADQEQGGVAVGEGADHAGAAPDLAHDALQRVVRAQGAVVFRGEGIVAEGLLDAVPHQRGCTIRISVPSTILADFLREIAA
jgi:hypothetical protein